MQWDETKHPRDDAGRFATKNGNYEYRQNTSYDNILQNTSENAKKTETYFDSMYIRNNSKFTVSKTIEEAQLWAQTSGNVKYVDYSKFPISLANNVNCALASLPNKVKPIFVGDSTTLEQYLGARLGRPSTEFYGVATSTDYRGLSLPTNKFSLEERLNARKESGILVGISSSYLSIEKITEAKYKSNKEYKRQTGRDWFFNFNGESVAFHEMGHVYARIVGIPKGFNEDAIDWYYNSRIDSISNVNEAWAEAWASYFSGHNREKLPKNILNYFERI